MQNLFSRMIALLGPRTDCTVLETLKLLRTFDGLNNNIGLEDQWMNIIERIPRIDFIREILGPAVYNTLGLLESLLSRIGAYDHFNFLVGHHRNRSNDRPRMKVQIKEDTSNYSDEDEFSNSSIDENKASSELVTNAVLRRSPKDERLPSYYSGRNLFNAAEDFDERKYDDEDNESILNITADWIESNDAGGMDENESSSNEKDDIMTDVQMKDNVEQSVLILDATSRRPNLNAASVRPTRNIKKGEEPVLILDTTSRKRNHNEEVTPERSTQNIKKGQQPVLIVDTTSRKRNHNEELASERPMQNIKKGQQPVLIVDRPTTSRKLNDNEEIASERSTQNIKKGQQPVLIVDTTSRKLNDNEQPASARSTRNIKKRECEPVLIVDTTSRKLNDNEELASEKPTRNVKKGEQPVSLVDRPTTSRKLNDNEVLASEWPTQNTKKGQQPVLIVDTTSRKLNCNEELASGKSKQKIKKGQQPVLIVDTTSRKLNDNEVLASERSTRNVKKGKKKCIKTGETVGPDTSDTGSDEEKSSAKKEVDEGSNLVGLHCRCCPNFGTQAKRGGGGDSVDFTDVHLASKKEIKKVKTYLAVTRVSVFDDASKIYEIMPSSSVKLNFGEEPEGIFAIKGPPHMRK